MDDLLAKFRRVGVPLAEFADVKPLYGIKTGLNEAFLITTPTKNRLIRDDPRSADIIKPYVRGQDIKRWAPEWAGLWLITLKSSGDYSWPWSDTPDTAMAEGIFQRTFPSIHRHLKPLEEKLRNRQDQGHFWWELRACAYYNAFELPKIITQDLATYSWFCFDDQGLYPINTCYIWPIADLYVLGWLCSPTAWWICHRLLQHGINDTLRMFGEQVKTIPIAPPTNIIRAEVEQIAVRLIEITKAIQKTRQLVLDWLHTEFEVQEPGARLEDFTMLDLQTFVEEVRKHRTKTAGKLTPAMLKDLQSGYAEQIAPIQQYRTETTVLERKLSDLINAAYGLTPEETALLWATAPPRMPLLP